MLDLSDDANIDVGQSPHPWPECLITGHYMYLNNQMALSHPRVFYYLGKPRLCSSMYTSARRTTFAIVAYSPFPVARSHR